MPTNKELLEKAQALNDEKKHSEVIKLLTDDLLKERIDADLYSEKAQAYYGLEEKVLCEKAVEKALNINPNQAKANNYKCNINAASEKYNKAIRYFNSVIERDSNFQYPYYALGIIYFDLKQYEKAIENFNKAIEIVPEDSYPYNALGNVYSDLNKYDEAIENYNKAIELAPKFSNAYSNRALIYSAKNEYQNAINDFKKHIELRKGKGYSALQAQSKIKELKGSIKNPDYEQISKLVNRIKDLLLFTDSFVTHYTSLTAAKAMILDGSKFRLSECAFLNDSSEGRELFKFLDIQEACTAIGEVNCPMPFTRKPFIGSFVLGTKCDDLTLWRMYGKESKEEAKGCSITIDSRKLQENLIAKSSKGYTLKWTGDDFNFYRMVYIKDMDNLFAFPETKDKEKDKEKELNKCMNQLAKKVKRYKDNVKKKSYSIKDLLELLNSIAYLFKSAEYQYEHEIRMVMNDVDLEKNIISDNIPPKVYIETVPINPIIQKITLGPKVERAEEWAAAFYYKLDKQDLHPEIFISHLPFK
jgi:tetratricopeptide (TPR) repeat protein